MFLPSDRVIYDWIVRQFDRHGYSFFVRGDLNLNLIGIRSLSRKAGKFDDEILAIWKQSGDWKIRRWPATTDPGLYWLQNPQNVDGTAVLVPGQYRGVWKLDKHRGQYWALCQRGGDVNVWRDRDLDGVIDPGATIYRGSFGINIHKAGADSSQVGKWSAGCQVLKRSRDFDELMRIARRCLAAWPDSVTYTLLDEDDLA